MVTLKEFCFVLFVLSESNTDLYIILEVNREQHGKNWGPRGPSVRLNLKLSIPQIIPYRNYSLGHLPFLPSTRPVSVFISTLSPGTCPVCRGFQRHLHPHRRYLTLHVRISETVSSQYLTSDDTLPYTDNDLFRGETSSLLKLSRLWLLGDRRDHF